MRSSLIMNTDNPTLSYIEAFNFCHSCMVLEEFLNEYGGPLSWGNTPIDLGELLVFIDRHLAKV